MSLTTLVSLVLAAFLGYLGVMATAPHLTGPAADLIWLPLIIVFLPSVGLAKLATTSFLLRVPVFLASIAMLSVGLVVVLATFVWGPGFVTDMLPDANVSAAVIYLPLIFAVPIGLAALGFLPALLEGSE